MRLFRFDLRNAFRRFAIFGVMGFAGCANTCIVGVVNNGSGSLGVAAGNPPPVCSTQAVGAVRINVVKSPACQACTATTRAEHVFVTLRGIELRASAAEEQAAAEWLEIAPELENEPRQIDLIGHSPHELLLKNAVVPAGSYREIRLQFRPDLPASDAKPIAENACGEARWNCAVLADESTKPLFWGQNVPELVMRIQNGDNDLLVVLPDGEIDLQLRLEAGLAPRFSATEGWKLVSALSGSASISKKSPDAADNSPFK